MDELIPQENENWVALLAAVVAAFLIATGVAFLIEGEPDEGRELLAERDRRTNPRVEPDDPDIRQAPWKMVAVPAQGPGKATKKQRRAVRKAAPGVKHTVQDLYDALTVSRERFDEVSRRLMPRPARNELRGRTLVPYSLERVKTVERRARIAIDLTRRSSAAAQVQLAFKATNGKQRLDYIHDGTLWLERGKKRWRVIAFDVRQRKRG
jgi:hypothetical protein